MRFTPLCLLACLLSASVAQAQESWERHKLDCEAVLRQASTQSVQRLATCTRLWETYRDVSQVDSDWRTIAHRAFDRLYFRGSDRDALIALSAMKRLGKKPTRLRPTTQVKQVEASERGIGAVGRRDEPVPVATGDGPSVDYDSLLPDRGKSEQHTRQGFGHLKKRKVRQALSEFLIAADADPTDARPLYGAAQAYTLGRKPRKAIESLQTMKAIDSDESRRLVLQAARDPVFRSLRAIEGFKELTGTAVIQILNGAEEAGEEVVQKFSKKLEKAGLPVASIGREREPRNATVIFSKAGFERQAEQIRRQLRLGSVHQRPITWQSRYDVILVYGQQKKKKWVDDEAEKSGKDEAEKQKEAEEAAKRKSEAAKRAEKDKLRKRMEMLRMMEEMDQPPVPDAPKTPEDAIDLAP